MWGDKQKIDDRKFQTLCLANEAHRREIFYARDYISLILQRTTYLFLAVVGGLIGIGPARLGENGFFIRLFVSISATIVGVLACIAVHQNSKSIASNARVINRISILLGLYQPDHFISELSLFPKDITPKLSRLYEPGESNTLYPEEWLNWGTKQMHATGRFFIWYNYVLLIVFTFVVVVFSWIF